MEDILSIYKYIFLGYWWLILPVVLFFILRKIWLDHLYSEFLKSLKWVMLEIEFPREAVKSPKAMEEFFNGLHVVEKKIKFKEKYLKGELPSWFNIEIVGEGGKIRIFIRTQTKFRDLVESQIYAQYPQAEIHETEDYVSKLSHDIPNKDYDIWGTELILTQPDAYPIRTYPFFFQEREIEERTDPIAGLFEFLGSLGSQENVWIQILVSPIGDDWKKEGEKLVSKLIGKEVKGTKRGLIMEEASNWIQAFINGIVEFLTGIGAGAGEEKEKMENVIASLTPGQREVVLAVENNIAKLGFKTIIRELYWAHKDIFFKDKTAAVGGFFKQFNTQNLNGFKPNKKITPGWAKIFKKCREPAQKRYIANIYKSRYFPFTKFKERGFVFNSEELATIFHIPIKFVKIAKMPIVEAKKGEPPTTLPASE